MKRSNFKTLIIRYHRHVLMMSIVLFLFAVAVYFNSSNFYDVYISIKSLFSNFAYLFMRFINNDVEIPKQPFDYLDMNFILEHYRLPMASDVRVVGQNLKATLYVLVNKDYFIFSGSSYLTYLIVFIKLLLMVAIFVVPMVFLGLWRYFFTREEDKAEATYITRPLHFFKTFENSIVAPIKKWFRNLWGFNLRHKTYLIFIFVFILFSIGGFSVVIDVLGWYFFFSSSFDLLSIFKLLFTSLVNLFPFLSKIPIPIYVILIYLVIDRVRCKAALRRLEKFELADREIIESLGIVSIINGPPGVGKTLCNTDMGLTSEAMLREKLLSIMVKYRNIFPHFNWSYFAKHLQLKINSRRIINRAHIETWIAKLRERYENHNGFLFGYDKRLHRLTVYDELREISIFDAMETYAKAYYLYIQGGALASANYGVRFDIKKKDTLFRYYDYNFFKMKYTKANDVSSFSIPMDMDTYRLGMKFDVDNPNNYTFEGGVLLLQEVNKERGNQRDYEGLKKSDEKVNQLNDDFNRFFEFIRHMCTIDNYPFAKAFLDYQRMNALNINLSSLAEHRITLSKIDPKMRSSIRGFFYVRLFLEWLCLVRDKFMAKFSETREDQALLPYLIDKLVTPIFIFLMCRHNKYDYRRINQDISSGSAEVGRNIDSDGETINSTVMARASRNEVYYLMSKKIFANRYATDNYYAWFKQKLLTNKKGFYEQIRFSGIYPTNEEYERLNSYLINDLNRMGLPRNIPGKQEETKETKKTSPKEVYLGI